MTVGNLLKSGPSGDNYSTPDRPVVSDTEANHSENVPSDQMCSLAGVADGYLVKNSNNWVMLTGKDYI